MSESRKLINYKGTFLETPKFRIDNRDFPARANGDVYPELLLEESEFEILKELNDELPDHCFTSTKDYGQILVFIFISIEKYHIIELGLGSFKLNTLPKCIFNFKHLEKLDLSFNQLISLPDSIGTFQSLKELELWGNQITSLPESIGDMKALEYLGMNENKLQNIPETIMNLKSLKAFSVMIEPTYSFSEELRQFLLRKGCNGIRIPSDNLTQSYPFVDTNVFLIANIEKESGYRYVEFRIINKITQEIEHSDSHTFTTDDFPIKQSDLIKNPHLNEDFSEFFNWIQQIAQLGLNSLDLFAKDKYNKVFKDFFAMFLFSELFYMDLIYNTQHLKQCVKNIETEYLEQVQNKAYLHRKLKIILFAISELTREGNSSNLLIQTLNEIAEIDQKFLFNFALGPYSCNELNRLLGLPNNF